MPSLSARRTTQRARRQIYTATRAVDFGSFISPSRIPYFSGTALYSVEQYREDLGSTNAMNLLRQPVVFFEDGAELVVGERDDAVIFDAGHCFGGDHGIDDGLLDGFNGGFEDRIHAVVGEHLHGGKAFGLGGAGVGGGERDENVARTVAGDAAVTSQTKRHAAG